MEPELKAKIHERHMAMYQVFLVFILPIALLYSNIIGKDWRILMLLFLTVVIYGIIRREGWHQESLGVHLHNFWKCAGPYALFTVIGVGLLLLLAWYLGYQTLTEFWKSPHFLFLFLPISFFQEFAYRGFLMPLLGKIFKKDNTIIIVNALLFSFLHIIYPHPEIMLPVAFVGGVAFAWIYRKYPNLLAVSIAHSILNYVAVLLGFFYLASTTVFSVLK